jgi:hypothetical protein
MKKAPSQHVVLNEAKDDMFGRLSNGKGRASRALQEE